jgi:peptidoglycan/xylan/chitin deacetylase (PgdA/CDA1 family)
MIRMRDDDVIVPSRSWPDVFGRFRQVHKWIAQCPEMIHVPTLITEELQEFPEVVDYIRSETLAGRMLPEFHGVFHVDYAKMAPEHVREHLDEGIDWMEANVARRPEIWYTPWGANTKELHQLAAEFGLRLVGTDPELQVGKVAARLREGRYTISDVPDEMFFHWWEGGSRVARLALAVKLGGWQIAAQHDPELFS